MLVYIWRPRHFTPPSSEEIQIECASTVKSKDFLTENVEKEQYSAAVISANFATYLKEMYS